VLACNDDPGLPWHRVVRSDGRIALPRGSAAWAEQVARLRAEGVEVHEGRVRMPRVARSLDAAIWGRP
jgi:methylated-DNA-protein-cysteine methyltransferase-like protein